MLSPFRNGCCSARNPCRKHREIALKYRVGRTPYAVSSRRAEELKRLAEHRYGGTLPDDDEGERFAYVVAHCDDFRWRADTLASKKWLGVSFEERQALGLTTIGAYDMPKAERIKLRRQRYRKRYNELQCQRRRASGVQPREQYEAGSLSRTKPWKAAGVSRATWFRKRETGLKPHVLSSMLCVTPVSLPPSGPVTIWLAGRGGFSRHAVQAARPRKWPLQGGGDVGSEQDVTTEQAASSFVRAEKKNEPA